MKHKPYDEKIGKKEPIREWMAHHENYQLIVIEIYTIIIIEENYELRQNCGMQMAWKRDTESERMKNKNMTLKFKELKHFNVKHGTLNRIENCMKRCITFPHSQTMANHFVDETI